MPPRSRRAPAGAIALVAVLAAATAPSAQAPPRPRPYAVRDVALGRGDDAPRATLLLAGGRVEAVLEASAPVPPGRLFVEGEGLIALPAFVDAWAGRGVAEREIDPDRDQPVDVGSDVRVDMRLANRKGVDPAFRVAEALAPDGEQWGRHVEDWHASGFGAALVAPAAALLSGTSALVAVRDAAPRDLVVDPDVFAHAAFTAKGRGFPSTLMGYHSQLRQLFLDARWHAERRARYAAGRPGTRPPFDADLEAAGELLEGRRRLLCEAQRAADVERWLRLGDELGFAVAIAGGREAWRSAERLAARGVPVVLTLDWGDEVDDPGMEAKPSAEPWIYEEPLEVRRERRRQWEEGRDTAIRLHEEGVAFAFGSGSGAPKDLLARVRDLVEAGLAAEAAHSALTDGAARILGASDRLGALEPGFDATLVLWKGDPLTDAKARPAWVFVDGFARKVDRGDEEDGPPAEGLDATGRWRLVFSDPGEGPPEAVLALEMDEDGSVTGTSTAEIGGEEVETALEGRLSGDVLQLEGTVEIEGAKASLFLRATLEEDELDGETTFDPPWSEEPLRRSFRGTREPEDAP